MNQVRFQPFTGKNYDNSDFKILILGESHYLNPKELQAFKEKNKSISYVTKNVVNGYLNYKKSRQGFEYWMRTFSKFGNVIKGKRLSDKETIDFWESIMFYNFVQFPTAGPRQAPTQEEFNLSVEPFVSVVKEYQPDICFLWGYRLWDRLPKDFYQNKMIASWKLHLFSLDYELPFQIIPHPSSSRFNYSWSNQIIRNLEKIKKYIRPN